ncbi:hypothetical protein WKK05_02005 [Nostoc sp. UHCC 0302]|uniref:hypothetical protein n=1 Tax=Nostoc sp. UHCC 0302 TaxID=3134896 RepID=UPI00311CC2EC
MKSFKKLSSIVVLLFAFAYPPLLAEAKASSVSSTLNEQNVATETNLVEGQTGELLIAQRRYRSRGYYGRPRYRSRGYYGRPRYRSRGYYGRPRYRSRGYYGRPRYRPDGYYRRPYRSGIYIRL